MTRRKPDLRDPDLRVRITVPGRTVTGCVSPLDIECYLEDTGWTVDRLTGGAHYGDDWPADVPRWYWYKGADPSARTLVPAPRDADTPLEYVVEIIARAEHRAPGDVLRDVEARAREEGRRS